MRVFKVLSTVVLAAFALLAGLVTAMLIAVGGAAIYVFRRLLGGSARSATSFNPPRRGSRSEADVIDVTATELPADPSVR